MAEKCSALVMVGACCEGSEDMLGSHLDGSEETKGCPEGTDDLLLDPGFRDGIDDTLLGPCEGVEDLLGSLEGSGGT